VSRTDELKAQATAARENLVATVGELGETVNEAKRETVETVRHYAPYAGGLVGAAVLLRIVRSLRR
jgi:hypothetical protein